MRKSEWDACSRSRATCCIAKGTGYDDQSVFHHVRVLASFPCVVEKTDMKGKQLLSYYSADRQLALPLKALCYYSEGASARKVLTGKLEGYARKIGNHIVFANCAGAGTRGIATGVNSMMTRPYKA